MNDTKKTNLIWSLSGGGNFALELPVTEGGSGWNLNIGLSLPALDEFIDLGLVLGASNVKTTGKLFPEAGTNIPGTYTENDHWHIGFEWGQTKRGNFSTTDSGRPWFAVQSINRSGIYPGWTTLTSPDRNIGWDVEGSDDTWTTISLSKITGFGLEFRPANDWMIMPIFGFKSFVNYPIVGDKEFEEWPFSVQGIELFLNLTIGYGAAGTDPQKGEDLTDAQAGIYFSRHIHGAIQDILTHDRGRVPQAAGADYAGDIFSSGGGGMGGGSLWLSPSLQVMSIFLDAGGKIEAVNYHLKSPSFGYKIPGILLESAKAIGYIAGGSSGESGDASLLASGLAATNNLATIFAYEMGLSEEYLFYVPFALSTAEILLSGVFAKDSHAGQMMLNGGTVTATGWMKDPEQGKLDFTDASTSSYNLTWGYKTGFSGMLRFRKHFADSILFTESGVRTPALINGNLVGNIFKTYDAESPYQNTESPAQMLSMLGAEYTMDIGSGSYFTIGGCGGAISQISSSEQTGGLAILGNANIGIRLFGTVTLDIGAMFSANLLMNGDADIFGGPSIGFHLED